MGEGSGGNAGAFFVSGRERYMVLPPFAAARTVRGVEGSVAR